jgi:DNA-binding protein YbaB
MFDNLKKLAELKKMQDSFKKERATTEKRGVSVTINGNLEIEEIKLNPELSTEEQQKVLKEAINEAKENMQKNLAKSLMGSGFGF